MQTIYQINRITAITDMNIVKSLSIQIEKDRQAQTL